MALNRGKFGDLILAIKNNSSDEVQNIIDADMNVLGMTMSRADQESIQADVKKRVNSGSVTTEDFSVLHMAVIFGNVDIINYILSKNPDLVGIHSQDVMSPLNLAMFVYGATTSICIQHYRDSD